jgi:thiamine biosynthesis protein ThiI
MCLSHNPVLCEDLEVKEAKPAHLGQVRDKKLKGLMPELKACTQQKIASKAKAVCLVSGGIDSPVAAWLMSKKGCTPIYVYFDNSPLTDETTRQRAFDAIRKLTLLSGTQSTQLYVVQHGENLADILKRCPRNLTCVLCRRMMYRIAEQIALKEGAEAIVTGEIIGEHASQTLRNLHVESQAVSQFTLLRPLVGMNKTEVEALARKIGTLDGSTKPASCCSGPPPLPRTRAKFEEVQQAEKNIDVVAMVKRTMKHTKSIDVLSLIHV